LQSNPLDNGNLFQKWPSWRLRLRRLVTAPLPPGVLTNLLVLTPLELLRAQHHKAKKAGGTTDMESSSSKCISSTMWLKLM